MKHPPFPAGAGRIGGKDQPNLPEGPWCSGTDAPSAWAGGRSPSRDDTGLQHRRNPSQSCGHRDPLLAPAARAGESPGKPSGAAGSESLFPPGHRDVHSEAQEAHTARTRTHARWPQAGASHVRTLAEKPTAEKIDQNKLTGRRSGVQAGTQRRSISRGGGVSPTRPLRTPQYPKTHPQASG